MAADRLRDIDYWCGASQHILTASNQTGFSSSVTGDVITRNTRSTSPEFEMAVEEFQCDQGLKVDGICGPQTQAKLKKLYGC